MNRFVATGILLFSLILMHLHVFPQLDLRGELGKRLHGKKKFGEIMNVVHSFYNERRGKLSEKDTAQRKYINRQLKFWNRWEWYNRARLDKNGEIVNVNEHNWKILQQMRSTGSVELNSLNSSYAFWVPIGPTSFTTIGGGVAGGLGRVNCIAFHPTDPNVFYIGCPGGGIWRTSIGGNSWVPLSDHIPSLGVSGIVVSSDNPNTLYILTGDGDVSIFANDVGVWRSSIGVLKSTDGGQNWYPTGPFPTTVDDYWGYKLLQDPTNANILFAATSDGIYKTINAGVSWARVRVGKFTDIEFKPDDHNIMYAAAMDTLDPLAISNGFYRSTNNGEFWSNAGITGVPGGVLRMAIGVSANNPDDVYLLAGPATAYGQFKGVYKSTDKGLSFTQKTFTPNILGRALDGSDNADQAWYDLAIAINPSDVANVITGGIDVWSSYDHGYNFFSRTNGFVDVTNPSKYVHSDIHNLAYNPLDGKLYACSDGGVSVSEDNRLNWTNLWDGLQIMEFYHLSGVDQDVTKLIGGAQDNGTNYRKNNSNHYYHILGADGYNAIIDYADTNILYFSGNDVLAKSIDGGNSLDIPEMLAGIDNSWPMVAMHATDHNILFAGKRNNIYKSVDGGKNWIEKGGGGNIGLIICPSNPTRAYACSGPDVNIKLDAGTQTWRSDNEGEGWVELTNKPGYPNPASHPHLTDLAVQPTSSFGVWITVGGYIDGEKVFYSNIAGESWTNISGSLPNVAVTSVVADDFGNVYIGTDVGVFYRGATMNDWVPFYNGLPKVPIADLLINNAAGIIVAATYGRGVFQSTLYSDCFSTLSLAGSATGNRFYEAANWITSTHDVYGGTGTEIFYKAGDYVLLQTGFEVKGGSSFKAYIGPCANGIPTQSRIYTNYNVHTTSDLLTEDLVKIQDHPFDGDQEAIISSSLNGEKEINLSIQSQQFVQVYFQEAATREILLWLVRSSLSAGQYRLKYNDGKLKNRKVNLIINIGGNKKTIAVK
jgi:hypothetical protein